MAPPLAFRTSRVTISGTFAGGAEEWSTGFWFGAESEDASLPDQALADGIRDAWRTFFINPAVSIANNYSSQLVKVSSFGTDGKSDANDTVYSTFNTATNGAGTNYMPPQVALVATLTSTDARGLGSKGRMYLPGVGHQIQSNGMLNVGAQNQVRDALLVFLNAVNGLPANNVVLNASHGQLTKDIDGKLIPKIGGYGPINKAVRGIKVGNVYDTQRRRRNGLTETYSVGSLA